MSPRSILFPLGGVAIAAAVGAVMFLGPPAGLSLTALTGVGSANVEAEALTDLAAAELETSETSARSPAQASAAAGIVFVEFKYDLVERADGPALEVWGRVANNGPNQTDAPIIEIVSRDKEGKALQRWLAQPDVLKIDPGESARFRSRMMYPLEPVHDVDFVIAAR
ncbi:MAG: hypothetical protein AAF909_11730 [Pseudomonadota bacterium]